MLTSLHIENIALIRRLDLEPSAGFCAFTGETGAGKSILIDAIGLLCGARGERELIRSGEEFALVEGVFELPAHLEAALGEMDISAEEEGALFLSRRLTSDGRSTAKINGRTVPLSKLREAAALLLNIHGQQDTQSLADQDKQRDLLDKFCGNEELLAEYGRLYGECLTLRRELKQRKEKAEELAERRDLLEYQVRELKQAKIRPGEEAELTAEHALLANSEKVTENAHEAYGALYGSDLSSLAQLKTAMQAVKRLSSILPECKEYLARMEDVKAELTDLADSLYPYTSDREDTAERLTVVENRLEKLSALQRKYRTDEAGLAEKLKKAAADLALLESSGEDQQLEEDLKEKEALLKTAGKALRDARIRGGEILSARVQEALAELDMPKVRFLIGVVPGDATPYGMDAIDFSVSANAGEAPRPIGKIASGGELSRIMLCLQCVLADVMQTPTLIFDEIDTGISGKTNEKIGRMMAQIASGGKTQVICVTHAAQLAACAFHQYRIAKKEENGRTQTEVLLLDYEERIGELARIMGGLQVTDTVRKAAEELLKGAVT